MEIPVLLIVKTEKRRKNIICFRYILACREAKCIWKVITGISPCCFRDCVCVELTQLQDEAPEKTSDPIFLFWEPGREISKYRILFLLLWKVDFLNNNKKYVKGLQLNFLTREVCTAFHLWSYRICISQKTKKKWANHRHVHTEKIGLLLSTEWIDTFLTAESLFEHKHVMSDFVCLFVLEKETNKTFKNGSGWI